MREIALIALRDYRQYILSRGFLLLLVLMPVGILALGILTRAASETRSQQLFVVHDPSGVFTADIDSYFEQRRRRATFQAWDRYLDAHLSPGSDRNTLPVPFRGTSSLSPVPMPIDSDRDIDAFFEAGGVEAARDAADPVLRDGAPPFVPPRDRFLRVPAPANLTGLPAHEFAEGIRPYLNDDAEFPDADGRSLFAALILPTGFGDLETDISAQYWSRNLVDTQLREQLSAVLLDSIRRTTATRLGLSPKTYGAIIDARPSVTTFRPDREGEDAALTLRDRIESGLPAALTYILFILIFSVGSLLLTNTIEERSNKIVETLLSSVTANQLMLGKLIGIGAVGLTIPAIGVIGAIIGTFTVFSGNAFVQELIDALVFSPLVWVYLFYFISAYVIFAMIYLAIGAISNSLQDAQAFLGPVTLVMIAPVGLMPLVFQEPNGLIASIITWIPIYTPFAVMLRAASDPPLWEIIGATVLMLVFALFFVGLMGRIFRRGLLSASPPSLRNLFRLASQPHD